MADKIEVPVWLIPKRGELDKIAKKGMKVPAYIASQFQSYASSGAGSAKGAGSSIARGIKEGGRSAQSPLTKFLKLYKFDLFWKWIKGTWTTLKSMSSLVSSLADGFMAAFGLIVTALILPFLGDIVNVLKFIFGVAGKLLGFAKNFGPDIRDGVVAGLGVLMANPEFLLKVIAWFSKLALVVGEYIPYVEKLSGLFKFFGAIVGTLHGWFNKIIGVIVNLAAKLGGEGLGLAVKNVIGVFLRMANIAMWISLISDILKLIVGAIFGKDNPLYKFFDVMSSLTDVIGYLIAGFKDLLAIIGIGKGGNLAAMGGDIKKKLDDFDVSLRKTLGMSASPSVALASGGVVTSPTTALIGEAGPEAVIPLDQLSGMSGGTNITVSGIVDEQKFRAIIREEINKSSRRLSNSRGSVGI